MEKITVNHTSIIINDYELGDKPKLEKHLSVWDDTSFMYVPRGFMYDENEKTLRVPRGVDVSYVERIFDSPAKINYTPDAYDTVSIKIKGSPKDNGQRRAIGFLIGEGEFAYSKKYSQLLLNLPPGEGKTVISTLAIATMGMKSIIITHIERIRKQWFDTLIGMTDLTENDICVINGSHTIKKLMNSDKNKYKIYLVNHGTLLSYAKINGWDAVGEVFKHLKIGVKIIDEAHLNFDNIIKIDLHTNTKKSIYLTATFGRSDANENKLFIKCFKNVVRFTLDVARKEKRKHTIYLSVLYSSNPSVADQASMFGYYGFKKNKYAEYQKNSEDFYAALMYAVDHFKSKEGKMLILSTKIELVDSIVGFLKEQYPKKKINSYHSKVDINNKDDILIYSDIICSTPKSAGTGMDIHNLRTVIMTEAYSSKIQAEQNSGRLREYSPDDYTFYIELVDTGFRKVHEMYKNRLSIFKKTCVKTLTLDLSKQKKG